MQRKIGRTFQLAAVMPQGDLLARAGDDKPGLCEGGERGAREARGGFMEQSCRQTSVKKRP